MLFAGKKGPKPEQIREEKSLYPVLHVAGSLKDYQKELVQKEVSSLWELRQVGASFSGVLREADQFQTKLKNLGDSFSNINETAEQFAQVKGDISQTVAEAQSQMEELGQSSAQVQASYEEMSETFHQLQSAIHEIQQCMGKIVSIADQTNILAINASIEAARAGAAGAGFSIVAQEVHKLADSCAETASNIQEVSGVVTGAVEYLASSARELADYLSQAVIDQLERTVQAGRQYREDSAYIGHAMEEFNDRAGRLKNAMDEIAASISSISGAIDGAASGITGAAGSTRMLVDDMAGITARMDTNQEIVGELQKQMDVFANL